MKIDKTMIYPKDFEYKTGFHKLRDMIRNSCLCELGIKNVETLEFSTNFSEIQNKVDLVAEMKMLLENESFPANHYIDMTSSLAKIRLEGAFLEVKELGHLKLSLETIKNIVHFIKSKDDTKYKSIKKLADEVEIFPYVFERIGKILSKEGKIKDTASKELAEIREQIKQKSTGVNKTIHALFKKYQKEGIVEQEASISVREGRLVIPVEANKKRSIRGYVHDESSTGKTVYIEPSEIVELNNEIRELEFEERREIIKILVVFSNDLRPYLNELLENYLFLGQVDFIRSKALLAIKLDARNPLAVNDQLINWQEARHPLLYLNFKEQKKQVVPLAIELSNKNRILLISGPNAGGKSVCLKTVGLLQYMFQCGLLVPVSENSEFGIFNKIFIDIGDEQSIDNDLSTYSSHILNMKHYSNHADKTSLLLVDEFGKGTEPLLGGAVAESLLEHFNRQEAWGIFTTHYTNLKHFATSTEGIQNAAMLFDTAKIEPTYQLVIGKPGSSFTFEIARKIGLKEDLLKNAEEKVGKGHVMYDKHLRDIQRDKKYWENKRQRIRQSEKKLEQTLEQYKNELDRSKAQRKEMIETAKKEADKIISGANKIIEKTIREIKESNAEKERTLLARKNIESFKNGIHQENQQNQQIEKNIRKLKKDEQDLKNRRPDLFEQGTPREKENLGPIKLGDKVQIKEQETVGEVLDINGKMITVGFGNLKSVVDIKRLKKISNKEYKNRETIHIKNSNSFDLSSRKLNFSPNMDIRGKRADESLQMVMNFIDEAIMVGVDEVRILHGKGFGVLREVIRDYLANIKEVKWFRDEDIERGGSGITVVKLK